MRSPFGTLHELTLPRLSTLFRVATGLGIIAVLFGRSAPEPAVQRPPRHPAHPRYRGFNTWVDGRSKSTSHLLDTEAGAIMLGPVPSAWSLSPWSCSPWRDAEGQYHLVGQWLNNTRDSCELVRCCFPAGRVLDRVRLDAQVLGPLCWAPDRSDRILFAGSDYRLYLFDLPEMGGAPPLDPAKPRELRWRTAPPGVGTVLHQDPCWPSVPTLTGHLLVALGIRSERSVQASTTQLWWLQLSPDGTSIVTAERAIGPDRADPSPERMELRPNVGVGCDGMPLLAYLALERDRRDWDLWVMPIASAVSGRCPRVLVSEGRKLAEGCTVAMVPSFSADGRWVIVSRVVDGTIHLDRYAVPDPDAVDAPTGTADRPDPSALNSLARPIDLLR